MRGSRQVIDQQHPAESCNTSKYTSPCTRDVNTTIHGTIGSLVSAAGLEVQRRSQPLACSRTSKSQIDRCRICNSSSLFCCTRICRRRCKSGRLRHISRNHRGKEPLRHRHSTFSYVRIIESESAGMGMGDCSERIWCEDCWPKMDINTESSSSSTGNLNSIKKLEMIKTIFIICFSKP